MCSLLAVIDIFCPCTIKLKEAAQPPTHASDGGSHAGIAGLRTLCNVGGIISEILFGGHRMEMHQVRYFLAICSELNFTRAARKSQVSQPSMSRAIQLLEREFGGPLFLRNHGKIEITELGHVLRPYFSEVWRQTFEAKQAAKDFVSESTEQLRIAVMCTIAPQLLLSALSNFRSEYPGIQTHVVDASARVVEELLLAGKCDIAIYCNPDREPDERLNYLPLFREQMMIVLPTNHALARRGAVKVSDLSGVPYIERILCEYNELAGVEFEQQGISCEVAFRSDKDDWVMAMVASGFGFAFMPMHSITGRDLAARPLVDPEFWRLVHLTTVKQKAQSHTVGAFIHHVRKANRSDVQPETE